MLTCRLYTGRFSLYSTITEACHTTPLLLPDITNILYLLVYAAINHEFLL